MNDVIKNIGHFSFRLPDELSGLDGKNRAVMLDDVVSILEEYQRKQPQADKWIPCEERLPDTYDNLLICQSDGYVNVGYYSLNEFKDMNSYPYKDVIAWQPLPQPYKKDHLGEVNGMVTNADRIRNMTDEELALVIMCLYDNLPGECTCEEDDSRANCIKCCLEWLQSEAKEGNSNENT